MANHNGAKCKAAFAPAVFIHIFYGLAMGKRKPSCEIGSVRRSST